MVDRELEGYLRQFEPLKYVDVGYKSPEAEAIAPFLVTISGLVSLYGAVHRFEVDVDLRKMGSGKDLQLLAAVLIESFDRAAEQAKLQ
jgi:hypothetical protein